MAFQIVDDCLDLTGETESLGKTAGLDIYKNDVTLPILYLFHELSETERALISAQIQKNGQDLLGKIRSMATERGSLEKAMTRAKDYVDLAITSLKDLPDSDCKDSLQSLAKYCVERVR